MKRERIVVTALFLCSLILFTSALFAQQNRMIRRVMTQQEFERFKEKVGVYEEGKNYNVIINGHGTGLRPPTEEEWQRIRNLPILVDGIEFVTGTPPAMHDNSSTIWFPPIGDQDGEGSCVSWACGYYTKTFQEAREHDWDLSGCIWEGGYTGHPSAAYQDRIFSPDFIYHQVNGGYDGGSYYSDNMNLLERIGCCTWDRMPYDPSDHTTWPNEDAWRQAPWYRSQTGYAYMWVNTDAALEDLKHLLADGNLAIISINADLYYFMTSADLWTVDNYNGTATNHANTVVGYDDDYGPYTEAGNPNTYGAFKVANSWGVGSSWENVADGFYYISYECMKQEVRLAYFYENRIDYVPETVAVFQMNHDSRGECEITVGIGDISSPDTTKRFDDYDDNGGDHPYPSNNMVMDITEFGPYMSGSQDSFFLGVYDGGSATTGTIDSFSIEIYDDYGSGVPSETDISSDPPVNTVNSSTVYAQVTTSAGILGDVNGDEAVNSTDALIILSCDVGIDVSQFCPMNCGDVNSDGLVNSTDALIILSYDVGIETPYPVAESGCPGDVTPCPGCNP